MLTANDLDIGIKRWEVAKFNGKAPTRTRNFFRMAVGVGPKLPVEVIVGGDDRETEFRYPVADTKWPILRFINWIRRMFNATD